MRGTDFRLICGPLDVIVDVIQMCQENEWMQVDIVAQRPLQAMFRIVRHKKWQKRGEEGNGQEGRPK